MKSVHLLMLSLVIFLSSCSASKNQTAQKGKKKSKITGVRPNVKTPSTGVINASGDALTPGVNSLNRSGAGSEQNAASIANNAIARASSGLKTSQLKLDTIDTQTFLDRIRSIESGAAKTNGTAVETSASNKIKQYAISLLKDHQLLRNDLEKIKPNSTNDELIIAVLQLPAGAPKQMNADPENDRKAIDAEYIQTIIQYHQNLIRLMEAGSRSKDPAIRNFSIKYLPVLKQHLFEARELTNKL